MSLLRMLEGLNLAGVRYVVIGGVAATAHGSARVTNDLDICYEQSDDNRALLAKLLAEWKAYPRGIEANLPFFMDVRTLRDSAVLTMATTEGDLDVLQSVAGVGDYAACKARSIKVAAESQQFDVLNLPALIAAKRAAGRKRDIEHLTELEALLELTQNRGGK